jgi:hypothetical protein
MPWFGIYEEKRDVATPFDPDATKAELEGMEAMNKRQEIFMVRFDLVMDGWR